MTKMKNKYEENRTIIFFHVGFTHGIEKKICKKKRKTLNLRINKAKKMKSKRTDDVMCSRISMKKAQQANVYDCIGNKKI